MANPIFGGKPKNVQKNGNGKLNRKEKDAIWDFCKWFQPTSMKASCLAGSEENCGFMKENGGKEAKCTKPKTQEIARIQNKLQK